MAEHQGFMLLYTENPGRFQFQFLAPTEDFERLKERALRYVTQGHRAPENPRWKVEGELHTVSVNSPESTRSASIMRLPILRE